MVLGIIAALDERAQLEIRSRGNRKKKFMIGDFIVLYSQTLKVRNKFAETVTACPQQFGRRGFHLRVNFQGNLKHLSALSGGLAES